MNSNHKEVFNKIPYLQDGDYGDGGCNNNVLASIVSRLDMKNKKILDVGCGNGRLRQLCSNYKLYYGIDILDYDFQSADNCLFKVTDMFSKELDGIGFDYIFFIGSFYYHYEWGYSNTMHRACQLADHIIILDDMKRFHNDNDSFGYYNIDKLIDENNLTIDYIIQTNNYHTYFLRRYN